MADLNDPLPGAGVGFWTILAAAAGSLLTLRPLIDAPPWARGMSVITSFLVGFYGAPYIAELLGASVKGERFIALIMAGVGVNVLAGFATFGVMWAKDPRGAVA